MKNSSLYIHIPFCKSRCYYCNFCSTTDINLIQRYTEKLISQLDKFKDKYSDRQLKTIYIGGGTPSILDKDGVSALFTSIFKNIQVKNNPEITLEVNPDSADKDLLKTALKLGVNRLSIGIQSLNDNELTTLGRIHNSKQAIECVKMAREIGYKNISVDIIFALPNSTTKTLAKTLKQVLELSPEHISAYSLKIEKGTRLYYEIDTLNLPSEENELNQYNYICKTLKKYGYEHYEISSFAKKGKQSKHNNVYWNLGEYISLGASAHSYIDKNRYYFDSNIEKYIENDIQKEENETTITKKQESMMLALRLKKGIKLTKLMNMCSTAVHKNMEMLTKKLVKGGLATISKGRVSLTDKGMYLQNAVLQEMIKISENRY